jgi:hypothetical protein
MSPGHLGPTDRDGAPYDELAQSRNPVTYDKNPRRDVKDGDALS